MEKASNEPNENFYPDILQIGPQAENGLRKLGKDLKTLSNHQFKITIQKPNNIKHIVYLTFTGFFISVIIYTGILTMSNLQELIAKLPLIASTGIASALGMTLFSSND
jgi:hypothetical protein